jgi:hypothetical protein
MVGVPDGTGVVGAAGVTGVTVVGEGVLDGDAGEGVTVALPVEEGVGVSVFLTEPWQAINMPRTRNIARKDTATTGFFIRTTLESALQFIIITCLFSST